MTQGHTCSYTKMYLQGQGHITDIIIILVKGYNSPVTTEMFDLENISHNCCQ